MNGGPKRKLGVLIDGAAMPEADALAFWDRFSAWMEEHRGDLKGFAAHEGFASVHPGVEGDRPVLRASKSAAQQAYSSIEKQGDQGRSASGGSQTRHGEGGKPDRGRSNAPKNTGKRR